MGSEMCIRDSELPALVAGAQVLGFPSTKEGFGLAAMEALAAGVPVVARDLPVLREVFGDTVRYGSDVDGLAAALDAALSDPPCHAEPGRELAAGYTWAAAASAHEDFYVRHLDATTARAVLPSR